MSESRDTLNSDQVADYLREHPDFFLAHGELLTELRVPHATNGAVSLVEKQVAVLRERNIELRTRLHRLLDTARENDALFEKTRALALMLIAAPDLAERVAVLHQQLRELFGSERVSLLLFADRAPGEARPVELSEAQARIPALMRGRRAVAGVLRPDEVQYLFGDAEVQSAAVIPLILERPLGLLAIGATDVQHFRSSMDTLFISFIGDVLARLLARELPSAAQATG
jgi:uncharacterized protein YigA (DUF484 family)